MKYFLIENTVYQNELNIKLLGYPDAVEITQEQYDFAIANPNASLEEIQNLALTVHIPSLDELKSVKLNALNTHFEAIFAAGYYDETTSWTLFCFESNVIDYATLKNAIVDMDDNAVVEIGTFTGWQTSTRGVIYPLLKRYSAYMLPLTTGYRKLKTMIENCDTKENLDLIQW